LESGGWAVQLDTLILLFLSHFLGRSGGMLEMVIMLKEKVSPLNKLYQPNVAKSPSRMFLYSWASIAPSIRHKSPTVIEVIFNGGRKYNIYPEEWFACISECCVFIELCFDE